MPAAVIPLVHNMRGANTRCLTEIFLRPVVVIDSLCHAKLTFPHYKEKIFIGST